MSDFICCHNLDCRYSIYRYYCAMENKCKTNRNELCVFHFILFLYIYIFLIPESFGLRRSEFSGCSGSLCLAQRLLGQL